MGGYGMYVDTPHAKFKDWKPLSKPVEWKNTIQASCGWKVVVNLKQVCEGSKTQAHRTEFFIFPLPQILRTTQGNAFRGLSMFSASLLEFRKLDNPE